MLQQPEYGTRRSCRQPAESQLLPVELWTDELNEEFRPDELRNEESRTHGLRTDELLADEPDQHACCVVHGNVSLGPTRRLCAH